MRISDCSSDVCSSDLLEPGTPVTIEKVAAVATSRDRAISTAAADARNRIGRAPGFDELFEVHAQAWEQVWQRFGLNLAAAAPQQSLALNMHIFHVLQTISAAGPDPDAGMPPRALHREGYLGYIFWVDLFASPILTLLPPD